MNFITFVLIKFRTNLLAVNNLLIGERTKFDTEQKSFKFLVGTMTLVSSANNMGFDMEFIIRGQAFICIMNRGPKIDPWETSCFSVPQPEKKKN